MGRSRLRKSKLFIPLLLSLHSLQVFAVTDSGPQVANKHLLPNAVQVQVTPRGMQYFDTRLSDILGNLGVKLDEGYFPAMKYTFDHDINPEDYKDSSPENVKMYKQVRDLLTQWLVGFSMNNHRPVIEIGESGYTAEFSRFGLATDEKLMKQLGKREGAVLAIELEVKKVNINTKSVVAWDTQNEFLGKIGMEDLTFQTGDSDVPLKVRLPFYLRMNAYGILEFEALEVANNINQMPLSIEYKKLIVPQFALEINGKKFMLNNSEIDRLFSSEAPNILNKVRESLGDFATKQLPEMLNQKAKEFLQGTLEQVQDMDAPGQEDNDPRPAFKWGILLQGINLQNSLNISLTSYVEDILNSQSKPPASSASRAWPSFNLVPQTNFDIGLSVDRSLINRVLQLAFERKNFNEVKQEDGSVLKLMAAPRIDYVKTPAGVVVKPQETFVKMRLVVETDPDSMFLKNKIVIGFDLIAKLRQMSDKSGMQLVLHSIDPESMSMDDKYISWAGALIKGKVREGVKDSLREKKINWAKKEEVLPGSFPLPPEILGIKLDINRVVMDPGGHIVMYLDYTKDAGVKK